MSSKGKFIKNSAIYTIGDLLPRLISVFMISIYTNVNYLSVDQKGIVDSIMPITSIFSTFYLLGLNGALNRFYYSDKDEEKRKVLISTLWIFLFAYTLILSVGLILFGRGLSNLIFKDIPYNPFFKLMIVNCFFSTFTIMPLTLFRMKEQAIRFGVYNILMTLLNVGFCIYFIVFLKQGAAGNLNGYIWCNFVFALVYLVVTFKDLSFKFSLPILKESLKYGIPLIPHAIGGWIINASDRWFLQQYKGLSEVAIYSLAYQIGSILDFLVGAINKAYVPFFFKTIADDKNNARTIFEDILKYYSVLILSLGLGLAMFAKEAISIFAHSNIYLVAYKIVPLIAVVSIVHGYYYMSVNSIFYTKKTNFLATVTAISAIINIVLNLILVPKYGMYAAAFTTLIAYLFSSIATYIVAQKCYYIKWHWETIIMNMAVCLGAYVISTIDFGNILINITYKIVIYLVYISILFMFKILSFDKLLYYKNKILKR
ncbi:oligosaccharide flippase family protein [Clostridium estertheticum]|uniref:oligosaccharide flippase family protein n=1 Tax=Clostridium estertheticum TaxID=238834 RepID=UPI001CF1011C|nr:oligosaccharide flippase family protein [Clostridium estertheticum]MCB2356377.1 oligosaccharide flippase family protein [Clostridium estertheticum]WAG39674.1 oligosaccharide flippase family protein [Clostridium estertheticum]